MTAKNGFGDDWTSTVTVKSRVAQASRDGLSGVEIGRETKLASGTLYPILLRLEQAGWLDSRWEIEDPRSLGRPRRRLYRMTGVGAANTRAAFKDLEPTFGRLAWA